MTKTPAVDVTSRFFYSGKPRGIESLSLNKIILLAEQDKRFEEACYSSELNAFWVSSRKKLLKGTFEPHILDGLDVFDQFRGQYYYNKAIQKGELNVTGQDTPNLLKAIELHFFDAIYCMMQHLPSNDLPAVLGLLSNLNPKNTTPSLLLFAQAYLNYAQTHVITDPEYDVARVSACLDQAYVLLHQAEKRYVASQKFIYDATYGLGLQHIFPEFTSFENAKMHIVTLMENSGQQDLPPHISSLLDRANREQDALVSEERTSLVVR